MTSPEFQLVFERLRAILEEYEPELVVTAIGDGGYSLDTRIPYKGKPMFFGAVKQGKNYVSFHLMPIYAVPELLAGISPELKKRMQGKSCFNFRHVEEALFTELAGLTRASFERFRARGLA